MKKILNSLIILIIVIFLTIEVILNSSSVVDSARFSFNMWKDNIFPTLFPFFVISNLLINYGFVELVGELFKPIMSKLFKIKGESSFVFILSMLSGFPSNAKYTLELYNNNIIDDKEATKLLTFTHFPNPLFVIGTVALSFLGNKNYGFIILASIYISNILIGIMYRFYNPTNNTSKIDLKSAYKKMKERYKKNKTFGIILTKTLVDSINMLLLILGAISLFLILNKIIVNVFNLNDYFRAFTSSVLEMTGGLKYTSLLNIPINYKIILTSMILAFGGLSIHTQIYSIICETKIKFFPYFISRFIHVILSGLICFILLNIVNI